jgi:hypothetical protein
MVQKKMRFHLDDGVAISLGLVSFFFADKVSTIRKKGLLTVQVNSDNALHRERYDAKTCAI